MKLSIIIITPLSLLLVFLLLSNQGAPIVYAQPTGWVELIGERTRTGKSFYDPSRPGIGLVKIDVAKVHYDGPNWKDIDNTLVPSLANVPTLGLVDLEMTTDDYEFYALQTLNTIPLWFYRNKTLPDTYVTFNPQTLHWTNDQDDIDLISMPQSVLGTVMDNRLHWKDAYGPGINLTLSAQGGKLAKVLTLEAMPRAPAQYIIDGGNPALELQFIFGIPSGPDAPELWIDGVLWGQSSRTETVNTVEFKKNGETIFNFAEPTTSDSSTIGIANPTFVFTKQGPNLRVAIRVPLSFLENAVYPVVIDPTVSISVAASLDDGYSYGSTFDNTNIGMFVGNSPSALDIFARFTSVNIPQGNTIVASNITCVNYLSVGSVLTNLFFEDSDNAVAPTSRAEHQADVRTTAFTVWDGGFGDGISDSLNGAVQEVIIRGGWSSGNALMVLWDDNGTTGGNYIGCATWDHTTLDPMLLQIEHSGNEPPVIVTGASLTLQAVQVSFPYTEFFNATDPNNDALTWTLVTDNSFLSLEQSNWSAWVNGTPLIVGDSFYVNVSVSDSTESDYVNYTLAVTSPTPELFIPLYTDAFYFLIGFIPFLTAIGVGFWKEHGAMLLIGGIIGVLLGLWVMTNVYWVFGFSFVGISILFMYIGWVNRDYMG